MKHNEKQFKKNMAEIHKVAKSLGLKGKRGIYISDNGLVVDLTASATDRLSILATIGLQALHKGVRKIK